VAKLTAKHERFCQEYIKDGNGNQAAIRSGYAPKAARSQASALLTKPNIKARIAALMGKAESKAVMAAAEVLEELSLLGRTDMAQFVDVDDSGLVKVRAFADMGPGATRCIRKIKEKRVIRQTPGDSEDMVLESTLEFELWDKLGALDKLGRHHDLFEGDEADPEKPVIVNVNFTDAKPPAKP
jgi:phage terminase small subunit